MSDFKFYPPALDEGSSQQSFYSNNGQNQKTEICDKNEDKPERKGISYKANRDESGAINDAALNHRISMCCVVFGYHEGELKILLLETDGNLSLPGRLATNNQTLENSARQMVGELSGSDNFFIEQVYSFGNPPGNNVETTDNTTLPAAWEITVAFFALLSVSSSAHNAVFSSSAANWYSLTEIRRLDAYPKKMVEKALATLRFEIRYFPIAFELLPEKFTLAQVQSLYEAISGKKLDKRNFIKKLKGLNLVIPAGEKQKNIIARPSELFIFNRNIYFESYNGIL